MASFFPCWRPNSCFTSETHSLLAFVLKKTADFEVLTSCPDHPIVYPPIVIRDQYRVENPCDSISFSVLHIHYVNTQLCTHTSRSSNENSVHKHAYIGKYALIYGSNRAQTKGNYNCQIYAHAFLPQYISIHSAVVNL